MCADLVEVDVLPRDFQKPVDNSPQQAERAGQDQQL